MIFDLPKDPGFESVAFRAESAVAGAESGLTKSVQVYDWGGKRWQVTCRLPVMSARDGKRWEAKLLELNGRANTFRLFDALVMSPQGVASGSPVFVSSSGTSVTLDGFVANTLGQLLAGDWFQIGEKLYRVMTDADSDATGRVTFTTWPEVPSTLAPQTAVEVQCPTGEFRLVESPETNWRVDGLLDGFEFVALSEV